MDLSDNMERPMLGKEVITHVSQENGNILNHTWLQGEHQDGQEAEDRNEGKSRPETLLEFS